MKTRFLIDPAQTDAEIVDFIMSVLRADGAFDVPLRETRLVEHPGHTTGSSQKAHGRKPIGAGDISKIKAGKRPPTAAERAAASSSLAAAKRAEPQISADMATITKSIGAEQAGLQHRLKTEDSLARKVAGDVDKLTVTPQRAADQIYDSLRYTNTYSAAAYTKGVTDSSAAMTAAGYTLVRRKNSWGDGNDYQGINDIYRSRTGQMFELQHHTPQSLTIKGPSHAHFEIMRATPSMRQAKRERTAIADLWEPLNDHPPAGSVSIPDVKLGS